MKKLIEKFLGWGGDAGGFLPEEIPNDRLTREMIPPAEAPWQEIARFSLTFSGYRKAGSFNRCEAVPSSRQCETLSEMRACLFQELRLLTSGGRLPDPETRGFISGLLDRMRDKVEKDERD